MCLVVNKLLLRVTLSKVSVRSPRHISSVSTLYHTTNPSQKPTSSSFRSISAPQRSRSLHPVSIRYSARTLTMSQKDSLTPVRMSDGCTIFAKIISPSSEKPLLIVHHGAPGISSHAEPEASFGFISDHFQVLVYDARGSGISDLKPPFTHERWVADLDELRSWAKADSFVLAGGSYGGFIALEYALTHPDRLRGLILRDTMAYGYWGCMNALTQVLTSKRISPDPERQLRLWTGRVRDDEDFKVGFTEIMGMYAAKPNQPEKAMGEEPTKQPEQVGEAPKEKPASGDEKQPAKELQYHYRTHNAAYSQIMPKWDVRDRLKEIEVPTLVTVGRQDRIVPVASSEEICKGIGDTARLKIFENSGHSPPSEEPEAFQAAVREFMKSLKL